MSSSFTSSLSIFMGKQSRMWIIDVILFNYFSRRQWPKRSGHTDSPWVVMTLRYLGRTRNHHPVSLPSINHLGNQFFLEYATPAPPLLLT